jgi:HD-GYP domain-containing protein (c-di-GMP phosphodiesterase class II)
VVTTEGNIKIVGSPRQTESVLNASDLALDVLERFAHLAPTWKTMDDLIGQGLRAVQEAIRADVVYWSPGTETEEFRQIGNRKLTCAWCREFSRQLLEETPGVERQLLRAHLPPFGNPSAVSPTSAAMVRISRSRDTWMVALSFHSGRSFLPIDVKIMNVIRHMLVHEQRRRRLFGKMADTLFWLVHCLTATIDAQGSFWEGHSERVARMAVRLGRQMNLPTPTLSDLYFAGLLHDLGRRQLDEKLLLKPEAFTTDDWSVVRQGLVFADSIMADVPQLQHLRPAVRNHHERFDGQGYPDRLKGREIPLLARILGVADACDAMLSRRPHRPGMSPEEIDSVLSAGAGANWDPQIVEKFMACRSEVYRIGSRDIGSSLAAVVGRAVEGWNLDSSGKKPARAKVREVAS